MTTTEKGTRTIIYARVSTDAQAKEDRYSIPEQIERCLEYAERHGWHVVEIVKESFTGKLLDARPEMTRVRAMVVARQADVVLVNYPDRFSREPIHRLELRNEFAEVGARRAAVTGYLSDGTRLGDAMEFMDGTHSAMELDDMLRRMGPARERKVRGDATKNIAPRPLGNGHVDFGLMWGPERKPDGRLEKLRYVENPETAPICRRLFREYDAGRSLRQIAKSLDAEGVPTPHGKGRWDPASVRVILTNRHYLGEGFVHTTKRITLPDKTKVTRKRPREEWVLLPAGTFPQLIDDALFARVQDRLGTNRNQCPPGNRDPEDGLLRRIARCGYCGSPLQLHRSKREGNAYRCSQGNRDRYGCPGQTIRTDKLDGDVWGFLSHVIRTPELIEAKLLGEPTPDPTATALPAIDATLARLAKERETIRKRIRTESDDLMLAEFREIVGEIDAETKSAESERERLIAEHDAWAVADERRTGVLDDAAALREEIDGLDYRGRRNVLLRLGATISLFKSDAPGGRWHVTTRWRPGGAQIAIDDATGVGRKAGAEGTSWTRIAPNSVEFVGDEEAESLFTWIEAQHEQDRALQTLDRERVEWERSGNVLNSSKTARAEDERRRCRPTIATTRAIEASPSTTRTSLTTVSPAPTTPASSSPPTRSETARST